MLECGIFIAAGEKQSRKVKPKGDAGRVLLDSFSQGRKDRRVCRHDPIFGGRACAGVLCTRVKARIVRKQTESRSLFIKHLVSPGPRPKSECEPRRHGWCE